MYLVISAIFIFVGMTTKNDVWLMMACFALASVFAIGAAIEYVGSKIDDFIRAYRERTEELKKK